jgi:monoterpene epsilon-lactone hydrolase
MMAIGSSKPFLPRRASYTPVSLDGIPAEWINPPGVSPASQSVILYLHGGGWTLGWTNVERWMVAHIAWAAQGRALAVDYRLAPEHPFPAALEDCLTAYRWLLKNGSAPHQVVIAGDSAGGNLTLSTLLSLRDGGEPLPAAAVCISPATDLACTGESFFTRKDPMLSTRFINTMIPYYIGDQDPRQPLISPHYASLDNLPPLLIHAGEDEILLSDSVRLADHARSAGVDVQLVIWPRMWHVWHIFVPILPEAQQAVAEIGEFIQKHLAS